MSKNATTVDVDDSMHDAMKRMKEKDIRMLPVLKKGKLVGVVTDRDIKGRTQLQSGADLHG